MFRIHVCVSTFFFFKQKTAYDMRISDWSSDVCSSDLEYVDDLLPVTRLLHVRDRAAATVGEAGFGDFLVGNGEIGRASCRERVCQYVSILVVAGSLKKKINKHTRKKLLMNTTIQHILTYTTTTYHSNPTILITK